MAQLFEPIEIGGLHLANRIVIAPMCQYSAEDGAMNDWHQMHLGHLAMSGAAALTIEATAVSPEGRITYGDVGLYDDRTEDAMRHVLQSVRRWSDIPLVIQLAHAGRKASCAKPWNGGSQIPPTDANGWQTVAPSALAFKQSDHPPVALNREGMDRIIAAFVDAAQRADRLGLDGIQIHAAHGYLLHEYLSPLSNARTDEYGGSLENRMRFPLEVFDAVRAAFAADKPVTVRVSGTDWVEGGWTPQETSVFARELEARGCAAIDVSSGGLDPRQDIPVGPGYQVPLARTVKDTVNMPVIAVGLITDPHHAEQISADGSLLYYGPLSGRTLHAVPTAMLRDPAVSEQELARAIRSMGRKGASDGIAEDDRGRVFAGDYENNAIRVLDRGHWTTLVSDPRISWPDTLSIGTDGYLYFTANQLHRQPGFHVGRDLRRKPYELLRIKVGGKPVLLLPN